MQPNVKQFLNFKTMKTKEKPQVTDCKSVDLFRIVFDNETKKYQIGMGNTKISSHEFKTIEEAEEYINSKPYELIINAACFVYKFTESQTNKK